MSHFQFPLHLTFKIATFANDFIATDANGQTLAYVRQKIFKLKEEVNLFTDDSKSELKYSIKADRWLDFSASYRFEDANGKNLGRVARKGWRSIWKAKYEIYDIEDNQDLIIEEANAWIKVADSALGEVPVLNMLTGYFFNPSYNVSRPNGEIVAKLKKEPSFFGRRFKVEKLMEMEEIEEERILLGLMMMILLERRRG
ncbi:hypothetical protein V9L05_19480 [Bernardetia sp. Wsw4-3y2]|uniref:hypothetical protein n=1 Tax=unclassified Bernardetia TaxID=2647129 RepID=UPI0030CF6D38